MALNIKKKIIFGRDKTSILSQTGTLKFLNQVQMVKLRDKWGELNKPRGRELE